MSALGLALGFERGAGFLANVLAARFAGAGTFGAYSLALSTANNIASYAGAGIGTTANRFVGDHPVGTEGHRGLLRSLTVVAAASAALASSLQFLFAGTLARALLHNPHLTGPLRVASFSAAAFILLECCRGLLLGQRSFGPLLLLSVVCGGATIIAVPFGARLGLLYMLSGQAASAFLAVFVAACVISRTRRHRLVSNSEPDAPSVWAVWSFGLVQLGGVIGLNAAGWWVASLVARADSSLVQMAYYALATQMRNIVALAPSLVSQSSLSLLTEKGGEKYGGSDRVLMLATFIAGSLSTLCAGVAVALAPWIIRFIYGYRYQEAELACCIAIATALVHMAASPAASRLAVVSLRATGVINLIWAAGVIIASCLLASFNAVAASSCFLGAHVLSAILVLVALGRASELPKSQAKFLLLALSAASGLVTTASLRNRHVIDSGSASLACMVITMGAVLMMCVAARSVGMAPNWAAVRARLRLAPNFM